MRITRAIRQFATHKDQAGSVMNVTATSLRIATKTGPITVQRQGDATSYRKGDRVLIQDGRVIGVRGRGDGKIIATTG